MRKNIGGAGKSVSRSEKNVQVNVSFSVPVDLSIESLNVNKEDPLDFMWAVWPLQDSGLAPVCICSQNADSVLTYGLRLNPRFKSLQL